MLLSGINSNLLPFWLFFWVNPGNLDLNLLDVYFLLIEIFDYQITLLQAAK